MRRDSKRRVLPKSQAESLEAARVFIGHLKDKRLNRYDDDRIFWDGAFWGPSQVVLSPNMHVARISKPIVAGQDDVRVLYMGDPMSSASSVGFGSTAKEREMHTIAAGLRGCLRHVGQGFEDMTDSDVYNIASILVDEYRNLRRQVPVTAIQGIV